MNTKHLILFVTTFFSFTLYAFIPGEQITPSEWPRLVGSYQIYSTDQYTTREMTAFILQKNSALKADTARNISVLPQDQTEVIGPIVASEYVSEPSASEGETENGVREAEEGTYLMADAPYFLFLGNKKPLGEVEISGEDESEIHVIKPNGSSTLFTLRNDPENKTYTAENKYVFTGVPK